MNKIHLGLVTILGFSFWFLVGFPFANHNESYIWVVILNKLGFWEALTTRFGPVVSFRPLGQAIAWLGYRLSGGSIYPVELLNYLLAAASWLVLFLAMEAKKVFSLSSLIVGGVYFSGYIYLFHIHGIFYSPLLFLIAILFYKSSDYFSPVNIIQLLILAVVCSLFHPYASIIFISFTTGMLLEQRKILTKWHLIGILIFAALMMIYLVKSYPYHKTPTLTYQNLLGLISTYNMVEVNRLISLISFLFVIVTIAGASFSLKSKLLILAFCLMLSMLFVMAGLPVAIIWIFACMFKTIQMRKWSIAFLLVATFLMPMFTGSGSPTYSIMALMVCTAVIPMGWSALENKLVFFDKKVAFSIAAIAIAVALLLRGGVNLPIVSKLANPLLAEREKTFQLEKIIKWVSQPQYQDYDIKFTESVNTPSTADNAIDRTHRPPADQKCVDPYLDWLRPAHQKNMENSRTLLVCFGGEKIEDAEIVHMVKGRFAGDAIVYLQSE